MAGLSKYQKSILGGIVATRVAYLVSREKTTAQIIRSVLELASRTAVTTIRALIDWFRSLGKAANKISVLPGSTVIDSNFAPSLIGNPTMVEIGGTVDTIFKDGTKRRFYNIYIDLPLGSTKKQIIDAINKQFQDMIASHYEIASAQAILSTIRSK